MEMVRALCHLKQGMAKTHRIMYYDQNKLFASHEFNSVFLECQSSPSSSLSVKPLEPQPMVRHNKLFFAFVQERLPN